MRHFVSWPFSHLLWPSAQGTRHCVPLRRSRSLYGGACCPAALHVRRVRGLDCPRTLLHEARSDVQSHARAQQHLLTGGEGRLQLHPSTAGAPPPAPALGSSFPQQQPHCPVSSYAPPSSRRNGPPPSPAAAERMAPAVPPVAPNPPPARGRLLRPLAGHRRGASGSVPQAQARPHPQEQGRHQPLQGSPGESPRPLRCRTLASRGVAGGCQAPLSLPPTVLSP